MKQPDRLLSSLELEPYYYFMYHHHSSGLLSFGYFIPSPFFLLLYEIHCVYVATKRSLEATPLTPKQLYIKDSSVFHPFPFTLGWPHGRLKSSYYYGWRKRLLYKTNLRNIKRSCVFFCPRSYRISADKCVVELEFDDDEYVANL